ncbi:MAG: hypothetical protein QXS68_07405 [Candidatus Methanomethylicaceae archaeon]
MGAITKGFGAMIGLLVMGVCYAYASQLGKIGAAIALGLVGFLIFIGSLIKG